MINSSSILHAEININNHLLHISVLDSVAFSVSSFSSRRQPAALLVDLEVRTGLNV